MAVFEMENKRREIQTVPLPTFAIDNAQVYPVKANSFCWRVEIRENSNSVNQPTADLQQYASASSSTPAAVPKGTSAIYTKGSTYYPGEVVGGINTVSGSITVAQIEGAQV